MLKGNKEKGITLIALVVTMIVLLILAGISIGMLTGENGILTNAKKAKETNEIERIKEIVRLELVDLETQKILEGDKLTIQLALDELKEKGIFSDIEEEYGFIDGYIVELTLDDNENVVIGNIEKDGLIRVNYKLNPKTYVNGNVEVTIKVNIDNAKITVPKGMTKKSDGIYEVSENGTYIVEVETDRGKKEKEIEINNIDRLPPEDFKITIQSTESGNTIIANTKDTESEDKKVSTCSGIEKYEYYIKKAGEESYTKYESNEIGNEECLVYAVAYDKAGNTTTSEEIFSGPDEYVKNGLILCLDGIDNTLSGHSGTSSTWYDLSNSKNNATLYNCIVNQNNIEFNGSSSYATLPTNALGSYVPSTIEIVMKANNSTGIIIGDNSNVSERGISLYNGRVNVRMGRSGQVAKYFESINELNGLHSYSFIFDGQNYDNTLGYQDRKALTKSASKDAYANNSTFPTLGARYWPTGGSVYFKGNIYSIRVYNRKIHDLEAQHNYEQDKKRFNIN